MPRASKELTAALDAAACGDRAVYRHDGRFVAIVPLADLALLEQLDAEENRQLAEVADEAMAEHLASGEGTVPLDEVLARAGTA